MTTIHDQHDPVIEALIDLHRAEAAADEADRRRVAAQVRLAEVVGVRRRDKDTGFDADFEARDIIVKAVMAARGYVAP